MPTFVGMTEGSWAMGQSQRLLVSDASLQERGHFAMKRFVAPCALALGMALSITACTDPYDPGQRAVGGGLLGAGAGAAIGGLAGGGRGAVAGALIGGTVGAVGGAATTPPPPQGYYQQPGYPPPPPQGYYQQPGYPPPPPQNNPY